jgi:hypothetical protein
MQSIAHLFFTRYICRGKLNEVSLLPFGHSCLTIKNLRHVN